MKTIYNKIDAVKEKIGKLTKDTANPFFKSKYADINQLLELTEPLLRENGLMVLQPIIDGNLVTQLIELGTGDMIISSLELPKLLEPQKVGSAITYYRRYSLKALLNLQEEDDDANRASKKSEPQKLWLNPNTPQWKDAIIYLKGAGTLAKIKAKYNLSKESEELLKLDVI